MRAKRVGERERGKAQSSNKTANSVKMKFLLGNQPTNNINTWKETKRKKKWKCLWLISNAHASMGVCMHVKDLKITQVFVVLNGRWLGIDGWNPFEIVKEICNKCDARVSMSIISPYMKKTWIKNVLTIRFPFSFSLSLFFIFYRALLSSDAFVLLFLKMPTHPAFFHSLYPWLNSNFPFDFDGFHSQREIVVVQKQSQTLYSSQIHWVFSSASSVSLIITLTGRKRKREKEKVHAQQTPNDGQQQCLEHISCVFQNPILFSLWIQWV